MVFYKGKNWGELSYLERAELANVDPPLYAQMRQNWQELVEDFRTRLRNERDPAERERIREFLAEAC